MNSEQDVIQTGAEALWDDVSSEGTFPQKRLLLAHYTSITTLESIMASNELWFSNPLLMNDFEEVRFGINTSVNMFYSDGRIPAACGKPERYQLLAKAFGLCHRQFYQEHAFDTYVMCFSEHDEGDTDGRLSMWRGYGANGAGAALVFDTAQLAYNEDSPFLITAISYGSTRERQAWIENKLGQFCDLLAETQPTPDKLEILASILFERFKLMSLCTKHCGFKEEREWRAIYRPERDTEKRLASMLHYGFGRTGIEPKLKFRVEPLPNLFAADLSLEKIIAQILLGPSVSGVMAANTIRRMLQLHGMGSLATKVIASTIPYRAG